MREILMLRARWRELETESRTRLHGTKGETPDTDKPGPDGPPRQFPTLHTLRTRSLADQGAIEDVLAVEDDVVPFDRADVLGTGLRQGLPW